MTVTWYRVLWGTRDHSGGCLLVPQPSLASHGHSLWTSGGVRHTSVGLVVVRVAGRAGRADRAGTASFLLPRTSPHPHHLPLRIVLPHQQSSWDGQSCALSCTAEGQAYDPYLASQTLQRFCSPSGKPQGKKWSELIGSDSAAYEKLPVCLPFWILGTLPAPFLSEAEGCTFFSDFYPSGKFLSFWCIP